MSYADDNTPYACSKNCDFIRETLEEVGKSFFKWFSNIFLKANADKCHVILSTVPAGIYLLKVNNRNTRARCEICSKLTIKAPERRQALFWCLYC